MMAKDNKVSVGGFRNRVIEYREVAARELRDHPENWRVHPKAQRDALKTVMSEIGFAGAVLAYTGADGALVVVDGHLRKDVSGDAVIPVLITDLTADEADALLAVYDPIAEMAEVNRDKQKALLDKMAAQREAFAGLARLVGEQSGDKVDAGLDMGLIPDADKFEGVNQYGVIIICEGAAEQETIYNKLLGEGYNVKVVVT